MRRYVVQPGDTLGSIVRAYGVTIQAIAQANAIYNPNLVYLEYIADHPVALQATREGVARCPCHPSLFDSCGIYPPPLH